MQQLTRPGTRSTYCFWMSLHIWSNSSGCRAAVWGLSSGLEVHDSGKHSGLKNMCKLQTTLAETVKDSAKANKRLWVSCYRCNSSYSKGVLKTSKLYSILLLLWLVAKTLDEYWSKNNDRTKIFAHCDCGGRKSGSKEEGDWPNFQPCFQNRFHLLVLCNKSLKCSSVASLPSSVGNESALPWFRGKKKKKNRCTLPHSYTHFWQQQALFKVQHALVLDVRNALLPGLVFHGGCWQMSCGKSHAWLIFLPISWKFSPSPHQASSPPPGKHASSICEGDSSSAHIANLLRRIYVFSSST